jgi:hypothetical protein
LLLHLLGLHLLGLHLLLRVELLLLREGWGRKCVLSCEAVEGGGLHLLLLLLELPELRCQMHLWL